MAASPHLRPPLQTAAAAAIVAGGRASLAAAIVLACIACGNDAVQTGTTDASTKADTATADSVVDADGGAEKHSCVGIAEDNRALFAQYDDHCAFLSDCSASGKCYCGSACSANENLCAASICADVDADCHCGDSCAKDGSVVICPKYVCSKRGAIAGCEKQAGCRYLDQDVAAKCVCTAMPNTEPNCYCGDVCSADKLKCAASKCAGKNPDKCIIVPGQKWAKPYCARCGLMAGKPRCFFVISPE